MSGWAFADHLRDACHISRLRYEEPKRQTRNGKSDSAHFGPKKGTQSREMSGFSVSSTTYKKEKGETTEWEDILIKKGIIEEKEENRLLREERELEKLIEETVEEFDPLEGKNLKQLDKLAKESEEYSDDRILEEYRKKRIEALQKKQKEAKFGNGVKHIKKSDFVREVTDASQNNWVVLHLFKEPHDECAVLARCLEVLAKKFQMSRFCGLCLRSALKTFQIKTFPA